ncbi:hypothetical protein GALL_427220 [mine drainage metagenome]|uniref:Uncharacterized protein n=1 Tax=mine drainage metagenome TaxID=410659 RepID=A0A1J5PVK9_9ZZZZ
MALEHEEQGFADLADVGDDLALLGCHQVAVVQEIVNLAAQQDAGVDQAAQELGQVFAVFGGNGQTFHDAGLSERPQGRAAPSPPPVGVNETWGGPAFP